MTLTLVDSEVTEYINMKQTIVDLTNYVSDLRKLLAEPQSQEPTLPTVEPVVTPPSLKLPDVATIIAAHNENEVREDRHAKVWDDLDIHTIRLSIGKAHEAFRISSLARLLGRTVQSINSKAHDLGYIIKNDRIVYKGNHND